MSIIKNNRFGCPGGFLVKFSLFLGIFDDKKVPGRRVYCKYSYSQIRGLTKL